MHVTLQLTLGVPGNLTLVKDQSKEQLKPLHYQHFFVVFLSWVVSSAVY